LGPVHIFIKNKPFRSQEQVIDIYRKRARHYDTCGIGGLEPWRRRAVNMLGLKHGDLVVDIGCGTGLNFALLQEAIGPEGKIIGVDLTDAMLDQARRRVTDHGWNNVQLVQDDAAKYEFPQPKWMELSPHSLSPLSQLVSVSSRTAAGL
jgi:ubiquinone/menaquinone biosynthesis C-methylase UbiE